MPSQPDVGDVHVNGLLTNFSIAHRNAIENYIADRMFPILPSDKQSDLYAVYTRGSFFADEGQRMVRAPGTRAPTTGFGVDLTNTFHCINYAIGYEIPDELRQNADMPLDMDRDVTNLLTDIQLIRRERAWATDFMKTGVWGTDVTGGSNFTKWSDYAASDPFTDLEDAIDTIESNTGRRPNRLAMGAIVWRRLKHHPDFIDRIKGGATAGQPAQVTKEMLARLLEIDEVVVGRASYRSSDEGATLTLARILDDDALLTFSPNTPSLLTPSAGITFFWRPLTGGDIQYMRRGRVDREKYDWIEGHSYIAHKLTEAQSGYFFADAVD